MRREEHLQVIAVRPLNGLPPLSGGRQVTSFSAQSNQGMLQLCSHPPRELVAQGNQVQDSLRARLYILLAGALTVAADTRTGMTDGTVSKILPGESVGEQSVLDDTANLAAITALEDSELLVIEADLVWQLIDQSNGLARNLLRLLSFRIRAANALLRRRQKLGEFHRQLSLNDALTGLYNRAWLTDMLPKLVARAQQDSSPLSLLMIDLDNFKKFNDMHGHVAGDAALAAAAAVRGALRPSDFAVRYGGEEMLVILPETSENWPPWWPNACASACARPSCSTTCAWPYRTSLARSASPA